MACNLIRFITAGSVDDGKSTLIGRLLLDSRSILADQIHALSNARHSRVRAEDADFDLALLTDGLEAEREQGITIDVAYRYFATARRKFIVADAPGHEQYTRNLVTGASQSDAAVILVDPTRLNLASHMPDLLPQTKRHATIVRLLGLKHVVFVINKMDLFDYEKGIFEAVTRSINSLATSIGLSPPHLIPISALKGLNVVHRGQDALWYTGPTLLEWLEGLDSDPGDIDVGLRFPVQYVARQDGNVADNFRGYLGRIESGQVVAGQSVVILPSGIETSIAKIFISSGASTNLDASECAVVATQGQSVVLTLADDIDVSRGDLIVTKQDHQSGRPLMGKVLTADLCWLDNEPLSLTRKYLLQHGTKTVYAKVQKIKNVLDIHTLSMNIESNNIRLNDIGCVDLRLQGQIATDLYEDSHSTGSFVLVDDVTKSTVAAGMIRAVA